MRIPINIAAPLIGLMVFALGIWGLFQWGRHVGRQDEQPTIAALKGDLNQCRASLATMEADLVDQNRYVEALRLDGEQRAAEADKAIRAARSEANTYRRRALEIAARQSGPDQCLSARELIVETLQEER